MKIILCLHHFMPEFVGGTEVYVANLAKQLMRNGNEVIVLIPNLGIGTTEKYLFDGIRVIKYAEDGIEDRAMILGEKKTAGLEIFSQIVEKENPSLVHFHELAPGRGINIFHVEKIHQLRIPVIVTFHVPYYTCLRGSLLYKGKEKCDGEIIIKRCTACIYQQKNITGFKATILGNTAMMLFNMNINVSGLNNSVATALGFPFLISKKKEDLLKLSFYAEKIVVIADWYQQVLKRNDLPQAKMIFIKQGLPNGELKKLANPIDHAPMRIVFIGRITKLKGLHLLIDALLEINPEKVLLDIYGPDTNDAYVSACKEKSKNKKNIIWKGTVDSSEVIPLLSKYHILCLPSFFEMSPLVIQEAFAAGIPVLASDVYGNAGQVKNGEDGWLFQLDDENDLKDKLKMLIDDPQLIEAAKRTIPAANLFEKVGTDHIELYNNVLSNYYTK